MCVCVCGLNHTDMVHQRSLAAIHLRGNGRVRLDRQASALPNAYLSAAELGRQLHVLRARDPLVAYHHHDDDRVHLVQRSIRRYHQHTNHARGRVSPCHRWCCRRRCRCRCCRRGGCSRHQVSKLHGRYRNAILAVGRWCPIDSRRQRRRRHQQQ